MADRDFSNDGLTEINRKEHEAKSPLESKRVQIIGYLSGSDTPVRISAVDNGDGTYSLKASNPAPPSALVGFRTTVTTAGTRVQLTANTLTVGAILEAPSTNTGVIYVGGSNVSSTVFGAELQPGQSTSVAVNNTNLIYIDSSVNGDKCAALGS